VGAGVVAAACAPGAARLHPVWVRRRAGCGSRSAAVAELTRTRSALSGRPRALSLAPNTEHCSLGARCSPRAPSATFGGPGRSPRVVLAPADGAHCGISRTRPQLRVPEVDTNRRRKGCNGFNLIIRSCFCFIEFLAMCLENLINAAANEGEEYQTLLNFSTNEIFFLSVQAKSVSILLTSYGSEWSGRPGYVLQLDGGRPGKASSIKSCWELDASETKCEVVSFVSFVAHACVKKYI
jgi:hypothetical protein